MESSFFDNVEYPWDLIKSYFNKDHLCKLVRHQLESYNNFIKMDIEKTITMFNPVKITSDHDFNKENNVHTLEIYITFTNFQIHKPQIHENNGATKLMFPQEARLRNFTYSSNMSVDINVKYITRNGSNLENIQTNYKIIPKIQIGKIPIMVKSDLCVLNQLSHIKPIITGECSLDTGGYFIINGSEKTVLAQERAAQNKVYCFNSNNSTKWLWTAEIKSVPDYKCISPKQINLMISSTNNGFGNGIYVQIPKIKSPVPLFIIFRCLNVITDKDICNKIINTQDTNNNNNSKYLNFLQASIYDSKDILTYDSAVDYLNSNTMYTPINMEKDVGIRKKYEFTLEILDTEIFPHCRSNEEKKYFLGYMTLKLIKTYFRDLTTDDRDSYVNKRTDLTGTLLNNLFRNYFNKLVKDMTKQVIREINTGSWRSNYDYYSIINNTNIYKIIKSTTIENGIKRALSTGDFGVKQTSSSKVGVAQVLNRLTYASSLSHSRRISTPIDKSGKLVPPRMLHSTSWGFVCPVETPEGQSVGVVKNISYMTHITISSDVESILNKISTKDVTLIKYIKDHNNNDIKVFLNGSYIGFVRNGYQYYNKIKKMKYTGIINIYTSICFDTFNLEIRICNDSGRLTRPVLRVKNNKLLIKKDIVEKIKKRELVWDDLFLNLKIPESVLEYIDAEEQNYTLIAMNGNDLKNNNCSYTHCEIHPSTIFGILASCVPFPEHINHQETRINVQCQNSL